MLHTGRHFLQIPGPTNVPDRVLRAMDSPVIDHRSAEFAELGAEVLQGLRGIFQTARPVVLYPASGTGAWEAAIVNTLSPGDEVLLFETGHFSQLWRQVAEKFSIKVNYISGNWRRGASAAELESRLAADRNHSVKAVLAVHNETSTGVVSNIPALRRAIDSAQHPALLLVDTISSLGSIDYRHEEWGVDVTIACSQKGLMLPPGLSFNAVSAKALDAAKSSTFPKLYWSWAEMAGPNAQGFFPYTPATGLLYGLDAAIEMLNEEGLDAVFARHERHAESVRRAVRAWGLEILCKDPKYYSPVLTAVLVPEGHSADTLRQVVLENFDMSLGTGLTKLAGKVFRIGHLGDTNDLTVLGALTGVEMGLGLAGIPHRQGGVQAAMTYLAAMAKTPARAAAE